MEARKPELSVSADMVAPTDKSILKGIYKCREFGNNTTFKLIKRLSKVYIFNQRLIVMGVYLSLINHIDSVFNFLKDATAGIRTQISLPTKIGSIILLPDHSSHRGADIVYVFCVL